MHDALISLSRLFIVDFTLRGSTVSNLVAEHLARIVRSNTAIASTRRSSGDMGNLLNPGLLQACADIRRSCLQQVGECVAYSLYSLCCCCCQPCPSLRGLRTNHGYGELHHPRRHVCIPKATLGWKKPVQALMERRWCRSPKWRHERLCGTIVRGKAGLGDATVSDICGGLAARCSEWAPSLSSGGHFQSTLGPSVIAVGVFATEANEALASASSEYWGEVPVHGNLYSDRVQAEGSGFLSLAKGQVQLLRSLKAKLDLTPEVRKLYMARVNPLLCSAG